MKELNIRIIDLSPDDDRAIQQMAKLLHASFQVHWPNAWPNIEAALREVWESLGAGRISRISVDGNGAVLGWIGGIREYGGNVWELHPMVVRPDCRRRGIGRALILDLEERVRGLGGGTIRLGTDDEDNMTTLGGIDLYPNVLEHLGNIRNLKGHPYEFYQKVGFVVVGVLPDANGPGKPDIYMAKRVERCE